MADAPGGDAARCPATADCDLEQALDRIAAGGLVAYPTETVWGLGADAASEEAVAGLRRAKGRDAERAVSLLVTGVEALPAVGVALEPRARALAERLWPGPLTLVLPCARRFPAGIARVDGAIGLRCSPHPVARSLAAGLEARGVGPLTATSLNRSGAPPARTRDEARAVCDALPGAPVPVRGDDASGREASTVLDLTAATPRVLRWGACGRDVLEPLL